MLCEFPSRSFFALLRAQSLLSQEAPTARRASHLRRSLVATWAAAFTLTLLAIISIAVTYYQATTRIEDDERWVSHTYQVLGALERLSATVQDVETAHRNYLLNATSARLQPYTEAKRRVQEQLSNLKQLVGDNPAQLQRAEQLKDLLQSQISILDSGLTTRPVSGHQPARPITLSPALDVNLESIHTVLGEMQDEERRLLEQRNQTIAASHRQANFALWAATFAGLLLVLAVFLILRQHLAGLVREREANDSIAFERVKLEGIIQSAMDAIISVDGEQKIVLFNDAAQKIFGYAATDVLGKPLDILVPEQFRSRHRNDVRRFGESGVTTRSMQSPGVLYGLRAGGEEFPIEATISHINVGTQKLYTVILRDVTDRRRTEEQLQQAQKMEAIGQLAGGVAHDFNNLLNVILGYSEMLSKALPDDDTRRKWVEQVSSSANTGAMLTRQLLAFSRRQAVTPQYIDLTKAVGDFEPMLRRLLREDIELYIRASEQPCPVRVDPGQVQQLLLNLVANARDAMPSGGKLTLEVRTVDLDEAYARSHQNVTPGKYIMLSVADTGLGMEPEVAARIFEPFFTTKATGKGTGLGLSTVFGIAKQNGGDVWVYSEPAVGTIFKVYLPRTAAVVEAPVVVTEGPNVLTGRETLLLVEDSLALRQLTREVLSRAGYTVLEAEDGVHAVEVSETHGGKIDLLLTDIVMPRMRGTELAAKMMARRPDVGIVFMSGYTEEAVSEEFASDRMTILEKPYTSDALLRTVREVLERASPKKAQAS